MSSVGSHLRELRERRGVSLDEISRSTRVLSPQLQALEADNFAALPAPAFVRGFIRAYCQALGEHPDAALALYEASRPPGRPEGVGPRVAQGSDAALGESRTRAEQGTPQEARGRGAVFVSFVLLVVLGVALFAVTLALQPAGARRVEPRTPPPTIPAAGPERSRDRAARPALGRPVTFLGGLGDRLREGLRRSQEHLANGLRTVLEPERPIGEALYAELEELLIAADLGATLAADFTNRAREEVMFGTVTRADQLRPVFRRFLADTLQSAAQPLNLDHRPAVVLMLGVNGAGKTTTAAKLAAALKGSDRRVLLAAADTFRAAAIEQLQRWGERIGVEVIHQAAGSDPAAVVFDAVKAATARGVDALIIDTAGRLHTKTNLMEELAKLKRVIERQLPGAPHESLMVMDAPTGQNGFAQARMFHEAIGLTGVALTKLDGTAKGGIVGRIVRELNVPVKLVGDGERVDDLQAFDAEAFVDALVPAG